MKRNLLIFTALALLFAGACGGGLDSGKKVEQDLPTKGFIKIMADEGYEPILKTSLDVFDSIYRQAKIEALYVAEGEAVKALIDDSVQVIVITRQLTKEENDYFKGRTGGVVPKITPVAYDAVALILHPSNMDSVFTVAQVKDILSGKITDWKQVNPKSKLGPIRVVFDHAQSGTVRFMRDSILGGQAIFSGASALKNNKEVIEYVAKQRNAIGFIGGNWVSDTDDGGVQRFLKEIRLADVAKEPGAEGFGPYQGYLATGEYPFKRTVYIVNAQFRAGLGLGLASFLASDPGQRIVLKSGMLPANAPIRLIKTSRE